MANDEALAGTSYARAAAFMPNHQPKSTEATSPSHGRNNHGSGKPVKRPTVKSRPDMIIVTPPPGVLYIDVFRKVRENPDIAGAVKLGERAPNNKLEMTLHKSADGKAVKKRVEEVAPEGCQVLLRVDTVKLLLRGVDMLAEKKDVAEAITARLNEPVTEDAVILQRYSRGDQRAIVRVPRRMANALVGSRLVFGYSSCRVEVAPLKPMDQVRCNRCQLLGHMARACQGPDRSALCRRCGSKEHKAAMCHQKIRCLVCGGPHVIGSAHCGNSSPSSQ